MRFAVPVNAADEVDALADAGADELYVGYQDAWWTQRYGDHDSASRRQGRANLASRGELAAVVAAARACELPVWLALNSRYTEPQLDYLCALCRDFERMGGTGVIASDLGLLWRLRCGYHLARCLSLLAVAQNSATLSAFAELGVARVVLPRFVEPEEARALLAGVPGMEGEFMAFFDKCPWVDGYCRHRHGITYLSRPNGAADDGAPELPTFDTTYHTHACLGRACTYLEPYPCAACHLSAFEHAGAQVAKLGGRGRPLDERLRALRFLRSAARLPSDEERRALYRATFGSACACYYGAATQNRAAIEPVELPPVTGEAERDAVARQVRGSQTDVRAFRATLAQLREGALAGKGSVTLLVPPLSDEGLAEVREVLPDLGRLGGTARLCVNDLGTLVSLCRELRTRDLSMQVVPGTLLLRRDDPREVAHFLSKEENPPRAVWGPEGEPRTLVWREPPAPLVQHWAHPSLLEPSAQQALAFLEGAVS